MLIDGYTRQSGCSPESATLANVLAHAGVRAAHTGQSFSEAMLFGIGGGIGGGYWVFEYKNYPDPLFSLFTRHAWDSSLRFMTALCARLGAPVHVKETGSPKAAEAHLREALTSRRPSIVWIDAACVAGSSVPAELGGAVPHVAVVCGLDEACDGVLLDDRAAVPWTMTTQELAAARAALRKERHRLLLVDPPQMDADMQHAIAEGVRACHREMVGPPPGLPAWAARNCGLAAWVKWAGLLADAKDKKGWPTVFRTGRHLYQGLSGIYRAVEVETPGGAFRPMYADFLDEAGTAVRSPRLREAAQQFREVAALWSAFAETALSDTVEPFRRTKWLLRQRRDLLHERGPDALVEIRQVEEQLKSMETEMADAFPLDGRQRRDLLLELAAQLRRVHEAERRAVEALPAAVA